MIQCVRDSSTVMILICGAMFFGIFSSWTGVLQDMMSWDFSDTEIGVMGFVLNFNVMIGGISIAYKCFVKKLRRLMVIVFLLMLIVLTALLLLTPNPIMTSDPFLDRLELSKLEKNVVLDVLIGIMGILYGGLVSLFFEL